MSVELETEIAAIKKILVQIMTSIHTGYPRWMDIKMACKYASMSKNTLMQFIENGDIKAKKAVGKWYIDRTSIDEFMSRDEIEMHLKRLKFI